VKLQKTLIAIAGATVLLGVVVASAVAGRLSSSSQTMRATFSRWDISGGFGTVECALTLEGSFHSRSIAKVSSSLIANITSATVGTCPRGSATILVGTLPWELRYRAFSGALPNITSVAHRFVGPDFVIREPSFGITCRVLTTPTNYMTFTANRDSVARTLTTAVLGGEISSYCEVLATVRSNGGPLTVLNSSSLITVTLI